MQLTDEQFDRVKIRAWKYWDSKTGGVDVDQEQTDGFYFEALNELKPIFQHENRQWEHEHPGEHRHHHKEEM